MRDRAVVFVCLLVFLSLVVAPMTPGATSFAQTDAPAQTDTPDRAIPELLFDGVVVVRVYYNTPDDIQLLDAYDVFEYNNLEERYVLAAVDRAELQGLRDLGFRTLIDPEETANFARLSIPLAEQPEAVGPESIPSYSCYRTVEETYASAAAIAAAHPALATWTDVGNSWEKAVVTSPDLAGYDMMVLKLTNSAISGAKPKLFITASIHAREYAPAELVTRFAEQLVNNYGTDADATWLLDHHEIHLMFHANPDGRKKAEAGSSWRKNTDRDDGCTTTYGTDLNRNFSYQWGTGGSSSVACNDTYRGPGAGSEPETQVIQNYLRANYPDQRGTGAAPADAAGLYLDIHSYGGYVMWPWGYTSTTPPNATQMQTLGRKVAYFNSYSPGQITHLLYVASGGSVDYAYGELGVASLAIEVGTAFFQSCSTFTGTVLPANLPALVYAAKVARTPYQTPLGPDALSLAVAPASVAQGNAATLTATINDTRYRSGSGEATQNIAAAEYYLDIPPWQGGTALAMTAADGSFNATVESVTAAVGTTGLAEGRHIVFVRGRDAGGNWGAFSAVFLTVTAPAATATPTPIPPTPTATLVPTETPVPPTPTETLVPTETPIPPTPTETLVATETPIPPTPTATLVPTETPIPPTPTETPIPGTQLYLGSSSSGTAGGVSFADEDILVKDMATGAWTLFIDGSDIGLSNTDADAFEARPDGSILFSFDTAFTLSGFGSVDDSDVLRFIPTSTGATTAGAWQMYFDGSDVGLSTSDEDVDALTMLPDGRLLISTLGNVSVSGASGADEDLLIFTPTQLGTTTSGTWSLYFDGSDVGLASTTNEDVNGAWVDVAGKIYLTTLGSFSVTGVSGDGSDIFVCTPGSLGSTTTCAWTMYWDGSANGFAGEDTDTLSIVP